jgi:phosphoglycerate dehydrogenase-like enzyme
VFRRTPFREIGRTRWTEASWMWDHPTVRITGHTSNDGDVLTARGDVQFLENLQRFIAGAPLLNEAQANEFAAPLT